MFKKGLIVCVLATFFFLGLLGTSFAGEANYESKIGTEAGNWEYNFDAPETKADVAAMNYQYDQEPLARVGTEAGDWEYGSDATNNEAIAEKGGVKDAVCIGC